MDRDDSTIALAVECKNLHENYPLLVSCVPRTASEAFHNLLVCRPRAIASVFVVQPVSGNRSPYKIGEMVGKKTDQVGYDTNGALPSDDEATFEKANQAVHSCQELVRILGEKRSPPLRRAIVPLLVVPRGRLWQVDYEADGTMRTSPREVSLATLFLNHAWPALAEGLYEISYGLSHLEIATFDALKGISERYLGAGGFFA